MAFPARVDSDDNMSDGYSPGTALHDHADVRMDDSDVPMELHEGGGLDDSGEHDDKAHCGDDF